MAGHGSDPCYRNQYVHVLLGKLVRKSEEPFILLCRVNKNGDTISATPDGRLSATVNATGVVAAPTNRPAGLDCYGKTLDELRSSGRIMEFQRTK
jgi:hypothetical protein